MESHTMAIYLHKWQMHFIKTSLNNFSWHLKEENKEWKDICFVSTHASRFWEMLNTQMIYDCIKEVK